MNQTNQSINKSLIYCNATIKIKTVGIVYPLDTPSTIRRKNVVKTASNRSIGISRLVVFFFLVVVVETNNSNRKLFCFVTSLAQLPQLSSHQDVASNNSRRHFLFTIIGSTTTFSSVFLANRILTYPAHAAIDISGLRVEPRTPTSTDVFLGGTYFADFTKDDDNDNATSLPPSVAAAAKREEIIDRIGLMKYTIDLSGLGLGMAPKNGSRSIIVRGRSSTISSRSDYSVELSGTIFSCQMNNTNSSGGSSPMGAVTSPQQQQRQRQCITIDFSPSGGSKEVQGYWDEKENGIRFILDNKVWSKQ